MKRFYLLLLMLTTLSSYSMEEIYPFTEQKEAKLFKSLTESIRCVVCQNQSIADSKAPLANDLRQKIYEKVIAHESETAIKQYLVARYGEFILFTPLFSTKKALLWLFPVFSLSFGLFFIYQRSKNNEG